MNDYLLFEVMQDWLVSEGWPKPTSTFDRIIDTITPVPGNYSEDTAVRFLMDVGDTVGLAIPRRWLTVSSTFNDLMSYIQFLKRVNYESYDSHVPRHRHHNRY